MQATWIRRMFYGGGMVALIGAGVILFRMTSNPVPPDREPFPDPNGYERFLDAANRLKGEPPAQLDGDDLQLRDFVLSNREALAILRDGLAMECRVTINYRTNVAAYSSAHMPELAALKKLGRTLAAEGLVARSEGRKRDAMESFLDCMRLGQASSRGGVMIDGLVGIAVERLGLNRARDLLPEIDGSDCRLVTQKLESLRRTRTSAGDILANEKLWVERMFGWRDRFAGLLMRKQLKSVRENFVQKTLAHEQVADLFLIESAIRAHGIEHNELPARLEDLAPEYLGELPIDPVLQTDYVYDRATGTVKPVGVQGE